jgi:hypothetical protein
MIVKEYVDKSKSKNNLIAAGDAAEKQMAFYLRRGFASLEDMYVLNDIRIVDPEQQHDGLGEDACQIDHLVLHRWGMFIVESKSSVGKVVIRSDGSGGDEWTFGGKGRRSPIKQADMQAEYLRAFVQRHREQLLGLMPKGTRKISKLLSGSDHRGVGGMPMQAVVALSDSATISRGKWNEPSEPYQAYVCKADLACDKIMAEYKRHKKASGLLGKPDGEYGIWSMKPEETQIIAEFLLESHSPRTMQAPAIEHKPRRVVRTANAVKKQIKQGAVCQHCQCQHLDAKSGRYGYYWICQDCGKNTAMPKTCGVCGADGKKTTAVRVHKDGPKYFRSCESCGIEECIWNAPVTV